MSAERSLMFVHRGIDVEDQWEKAVVALVSMSNLEIAIVWKRMSESVTSGDFRTHSELKCLFKRAVREAESRTVAVCDDSPKVVMCSCRHEDRFGSEYDNTSIHFEEGHQPVRPEGPNGLGYHGRQFSNTSHISNTESQREAMREFAMEKMLSAVIRGGLFVGGQKVMDPVPIDQIQTEEIVDYCKGFLEIIATKSDGEIKNKILNAVITEAESLRAGIGMH